MSVEPMLEQRHLGRCACARLFSERHVSAGGVTVYGLTRVGSATPGCALSPSSTSGVGLAKPSSIGISPEPLLRERCWRAIASRSCSFGERLALDQDLAERWSLPGSTAACSLSARDDPQRRRRVVLRLAGFSRTVREPALRSPCGATSRRAHRAAFYPRAAGEQSGEPPRSGDGFGPETAGCLERPTSFVRKRGS